jgi:dipeptidyl aminopeptidase/acylaminoacyl peptidase
MASLVEPMAKPKKLTEGVDPAISPDGKTVAFTQNDAEGNRRIATVDVATGKVTVVSGIPGKNEFMPRWSADGKELFFSHFDESDWSFAKVNATGGGFAVVVDKAVRQVAAASPLPDGKRWLCHDLEGFYLLTFGDDGKASFTDLPQVKTESGLSMPSQIAVSADGAFAIIQLDMDEEVPGEDGPLSALHRLEIKTGELTRLTAKGVFAHGPSLLPGGKEILFGGFDQKTDEPAVYRMPLDGSSAPVRLWIKAMNPSASAR